MQRAVVNIIFIVILFCSCQSLEKNPKPCSKTPVDQRFDLKDNSRFFDPGTYWVYQDTITGKLDSLYVVNSKFFDRQEDFCSSLISIRSTEIELFSTYLNSAVFWRFDYSVQAGPNNRLEITEGSNEAYKFYLFHPDHNVTFKKDTFKEKNTLLNKLSSFHIKVI